jgi:hypothetical protein
MEKRYCFDQPRKKDILSPTCIRYYYNEKTEERDISSHEEGTEQRTLTVYSYRSADVPVKEGSTEATKGELVDALIRNGATFEKDGQEVDYPGLSINDELAIQRQRSTKKAEFNAYNDFAEACKVIADELLNENTGD